jgi:transposase
MTQVHDIRKMYFEEGKSISEIARSTSHDRKTIRAYLEKEDWNIAIPSVSTDEPSFPKLEPFKSLIDSWLTEDKKARRKQRHTARRVYSRLIQECNEEFNCSYRTVAGYVALKKREIFGTQKRAAIPLEHIPGEAQVDFGDCDFYLNDMLYSGKYLNVSFPYSNQGFMQLFKGENQQCLFEGLVAIFNHVGGVPTRLWFDNTSTIVTNILKDGGRHLTEGFLRFQEHYRFEAVFCNPDSGHEKGNVEGKVGYHRRNMLVPIPKLNDLRVYNQELLAKCDNDGNREHYRKGDTIINLYAEDRKALLELPAVALDIAQYRSIKTNAYGKFLLYKGFHEYSVSPKYANRQVLVRLSAHEVVVMDENHREIVRHDRLYGESKQCSMQWLPYLNQLAKSPGALKYTGIYQMFPETMKAYIDQCSKNQKGSILRAIAALTERDSFESALKTVETALTYQAHDTDSLVNLHRRIHSATIELPPLQLGDCVPRLSPVRPDLNAYDRSLSQKGGNSGC